MGGSLLLTVRTVNPGSDLAATAVNSKISTGLPLGWDGTGWRSHCLGGSTALWDTEGRAAAAKLCPETLEPPILSSLSPQPLRGTRTAAPCAQNHKMFVIRLWLLLSSCSSVLWGSGNCLCYRKVHLKTAGVQVPQLRQAPGPGTNRGGERHRWRWPQRTSDPAPRLAPGTRGRYRGSRADLPPGATGRRQRTIVKDSSCEPRL